MQPTPHVRLRPCHVRCRVASTLALPILTSAGLAHAQCAPDPDTPDQRTGVATYLGTLGGVVRRVAVEPPAELHPGVPRGDALSRLGLETCYRDHGSARRCSWWSTTWGPCGPGPAPVRLQQGARSLTALIARQ